MYKAFYKLISNPFQLTPDPRFFYASSVHRRALAYLRYGLEQGEGFVVITGDVGAGKTTLVRTLLEEAAKRNVLAVQLVSTQLDAEDILRQIAAAFRVQSEGISKAQLLRNIEVYLKYQVSEGKRVLLVIDEAQNLPQRSLEELRMLSNFQNGDKPLLQSFLVGQPEFRFKIEQPENEQLKQRVIASYHLGPIKESELKEYIVHRLKCAGWAGDPLFDDDAISEIFAYTNGIPRKINVFCDRLMLYGSLEELHQFSASVVKTVQNEMVGAGVPQARTAVNTSVAGEFDEEALSQFEGIQSIERRLISLEQQMLNFDKSFNRECAMLRKVILHYSNPKKPDQEEEF